MGIQYLPYHQVDKQRWDACIKRSANGLIYAYSIYLDTMAHYWDALVLNDYEAVMPLAWNKKYGIYYLYQPFITASLGIFGNQVTADLVNDFLMAIPAKFRYWDIYLNYANRFHLKHFTFYDRANFVLPLDKTYEQIHAGFRIGLKQSIRRAEQLNCAIRKDIDVNEVIALAKEQGKSFSPAKEEDYTRFKKLYDHLFQQQQATTYGVYMPSGELVASAVIFFSNKRAYYILAGNHPNGRTIGASHALINAFIKDHAGQDILLDFEGSDIQSLAFFYGSFGATKEMYSGLKLNKLPKLVQLFKK